MLGRTLSEVFGAGASAYSLPDLRAWRELGVQAAAAAAQQNWAEAARLAEASTELRPDWPKGFELYERALARLHLAAGSAPTAAEAEAEDQRSLACPTESSRVKFKVKVKGVKLLAHELELVESGHLVDITHAGATAIWLSAESTHPEDLETTVVYRPMGDTECSHLLMHGTLPESQPYQTIVEGEEGRVYAEKYLRGHKSVDSSPTTVVEFVVPRALVMRLFAMQSKNEDGAISHGLGDKGGRGLPLFNESLQSGESTFRIVFVKRFAKKAEGAFGAGRRKW
eukprot:TRINITY_DN34857_c0_g3_i1.p1 TRINITY_DN34857_c0_g3~~TRINITY_DN34857_c0_g3_i1.p1  ORF type:complete len:290 (+),score=65.45 TRINITY_DN34857_c0_g3_i1:23-871(+)